MNELKGILVKVRKSFIGEWIYAGGFGLPLSILAIGMYLVPAILALSSMGYDQTAFEEPYLWLWAGSAGGVLVGLSEGKRIAKAEIQDALEPWQQLELKRYLEASALRKIK